jgi:hypothetical protein
VPPYTLRKTAEVFARLLPDLIFSFCS